MPMRVDRQSCCFPPTMHFVVAVALIERRESPHVPGNIFVSLTFVRIQTIMNVSNPRFLDLSTRIEPSNILRLERGRKGKTKGF